MKRGVSSVGLSYWPETHSDGGLFVTDTTAKELPAPIVSVGSGNETAVSCNKSHFHYVYLSTHTHECTKNYYL